MKSKLLQLAALVLLTLAIYARVAGHEFISFDDGAYITKNPVVKAGLTPQGVARAIEPYYCNWAPVTYLSHAADQKIFGEWAGGHHLSSVFFHLLSVIFLYLLFYELTAAHDASLLIAALFALHPLSVEPVAWASSRKDVLAALFWILTCFFYARHAKKSQSLSYVVAIFFYALAAMSKGSVIMLPFILLLLDYWPLKRFRVAEKIPFFAIALICFLMNASAQIGGGCTKDFDAVPLKFRFANAAISYVAYLRKMVWPTDLAIFYPYTRDTVALIKLIFAVVILIAITISVILLRKKRPQLFVGWVWYVVSLLPMIQLIQTGGHSMADRYAYVPLIGIYMALVFSKGTGLISPKINPAPFGMLLLALLAWFQVGYWKNTGTIFRHAAAVTKNNFIAHISLGDEATLRENFTGARDEYEKAIAIRPDPGTLHNLATTYYELKDFDKAGINYTRALQMDPGQVVSWINLAMVFQEKGDLQKAGYYYVRALAIDRDNIDATVGLINVLVAQNRTEEAKHLLERARKNHPDDPRLQKVPG